MIDWIRTAQGVAATVAAIFATIAAWWNLGLPRLVFSPEAPVRRRIEALERLNRDTRLVVPDQTLVECQSARDTLAGDGCGVRDGGRRGAASHGAGPVVIIAA